jgi:hypothetical protein
MPTKRRSKRLPLFTYHTGRIHPIGHFKQLPTELIVTICKYVIYNSSVKEMIWMMNSCNKFRNLIRDFLSYDIQSRLDKISFQTYIFISKIIRFAPIHLDLSGDCDLTNKNLYTLTHFTSLDLRDTFVTDFSSLKQVRRLYIGHTPSTLNQVTNLEELRIYNTRVTLNLLISILVANKRLRFIKLKHVSGIRESEVMELLNTFVDINIVYKPLRAYDWQMPVDDEYFEDRNLDPVHWGPGIWRLFEEQFGQPSQINWNLILPWTMEIIHDVGRTNHDSYLIRVDTMNLATIPIMIGLSSNQKTNRTPLPENRLSQSETIPKKHYHKIISPYKPRFDRQINQVRRSKTKFIRF